jgi:hypothetical protein
MVNRKNKNNINSSLTSLKNKINHKTRSFSTYSKNNNPDQTNNTFVDFKDISKYSKEKSLKKFKKVFGGGYLGYKNVNYLGSVVYVSLVKDCFSVTNIEQKIIDYLNEIPEGVVYSVLPFKR